MSIVPTIAAIIAPAARTTGSTVIRFNPLYAPVVMLVMVVLAAPVTAGIAFEVEAMTSAEIMTRIEATTTRMIAPSTRFIMPLRFSLSFFRGFISYRYLASLSRNKNPIP